MTIKIDVFNAGSSAAYNVELTDPGWDTEYFTVVGPSTKASFDSIAPGASASHSFVVVPKVAGSFTGGASAISYQTSAENAEVTTGVSNSLPGIPILTTPQKHLATALEFGSYVSLGFCKTMADWKYLGSVVGSIVLLLGGNHAVLKTRASLAALRRKKAVESLTKQE